MERTRVIDNDLHGYKRFAERFSAAQLPHMSTAFLLADIADLDLYLVAKNKHATLQLTLENCS